MPSVCVSLPDGTPCGDGNACNGDEVCAGGMCAAPLVGAARACRDGRLLAFIANYADDTVSVLETATGRITSTIRVGAGPWGVAVDPHRAEIWVTERKARTVSVVDTGHGTVVRNDSRRRAAARGGARSRRSTALRRRLRRRPADRDRSRHPQRDRRPCDVGPGPSGLAFDAAGRALYVSAFAGRGGRRRHRHAHTGRHRAERTSAAPDRARRQPRTALRRQLPKRHRCR